MTLLFLMSSFSAFAMETDNYLAWTLELPDASEDINEFIRSNIEEVLSSQKANVSCEKITYKIANRFKTTPKGEVFVNWSTKKLSDKIYPSSQKYLEQSIHKDTPSLLLKLAPLAPNIQTGGIYYGVDKLSHFASTGRRYLTKYLKEIKKGASIEEAERAAIRFGLANEAGILGIWASGIFSYGDVEANYQGLRFYKNLCLNEEGTYIEKREGKWVLAKIPDIRDYANPGWDESYNLSYVEKNNWEKSVKWISSYCAQKLNDIVVARFKLYEEKSVLSQSMKYVQELQASGDKKTPIPSETQSFEALCQK